MPDRDPAFDAYVLKIHEVLDRLNYYKLLGVDTNSRVPQIKKAFFSIAAKFHPDRNRSAEPHIRDAIYDIFKRLNEAYMVLCDSEKRKPYDEGLAEGKVRLEMDSRGSAAKSDEETISSREARQFFLKAVENLESGNIMQADLHSKMAKSREPKNIAINDLIAKISDAKKKK